MLLLNCWLTNDKLYPDVAIVVTDVENLKRNLLLFTQIKTLEIPNHFSVINMAQNGIQGITHNNPQRHRQPSCHGR
jgi:ferrous iron transport protein B